jgi:hypothetical protein
MAACTRRVNSVASLGSAGDDADGEQSELAGPRDALLSERTERVLSPCARRAVSPRRVAAPQLWLPSASAARPRSPPPAVSAARALSEALAAAGLSGDLLLDSDGELDDICPTWLLRRQPPHRYALRPPLPHAVCLLLAGAAAHLPPVFCADWL